MRVLTDFADASLGLRFPAHGCAVNTQGVQLLWLPVFSLLREAEWFREKKNLPGAVVRADLAGVRTFETTLERLVLALQMLHACHRKAVGTTLDPGACKQDLEATLLWFKEGPLYLDLTFNYLQRLADQFAKAWRVFLFQDHSKLHPLDSWRAIVQDADRTDGVLSSGSPTCGMDALRAFVLKCNQWARSANRIRNTLEHAPRYTRFGLERIGDGPTKSRVELLRDSIIGIAYPLPNDVWRDLLNDLRQILKGLCTSLTEFHGLAAAGGKYDWTDASMPSGLDEDTCGFWPPIGGA